MKSGRFVLRQSFPPEIISYAVWAYHRFCLSFRDVEDLLAEPEAFAMNRERIVVVTEYRTRVQPRSCPPGRDLRDIDIDLARATCHRVGGGY